METHAETLTVVLSTQKEALLKEAIRYKIGSDDWRIADLTGRGEFKIMPDKTEIFAFDGQDLIQFMPPETSVDRTDSLMSGNVDPFTVGILAGLNELLKSSRAT